MSSPSLLPAGVAADKAALVKFLEDGCKPEAKWRIGTEHEKFAYTRDDHRPIAYDGPNGIAALLEGLQAFGWAPVSEAGRVIALTKGQASISLEPGGQVELSGAPLDNLHQTCDEVHTHLREVKSVASRIGIGLIGLGFHPEASRDDINWMPKGRYRIMRAYMPRKGKLGIDMMIRTCTVQVNLDFSSEADMVRKFRVGLALQPIAVALFANSPFSEGRPNGYLSYRSRVWTDTDPDRCGMLPFVFDGAMGFERYVDYALDVPMYFVYRDGTYHDASGQSFRDFLKGRLPALPGELPTFSDWNDHLTTIFPEVRLKRYLEMRGADGGPWRRLCALPALWAGLCYDSTALDAAWDLVKNWSVEAQARLRDEVPRDGFGASIAGHSVLDLAREVVAIAEGGLARRNRQDPETGNNEVLFLAPLREIVERGRTPADELLDLYNGAWQHSLGPLYRDFSY
ncbi:MAG: glutamate--cysteine ligase [Alphaproteobacteria bacterium]